MLFWLFDHQVSKKISFFLINSCLSCWFYACFSLMLHTFWNRCYENCIFSWKMMKNLIFTLLTFSEILNSNLHLKATCSLTCFSLRPKASICFVFFFVVWFLVFFLLEKIANSFPRTWAFFTSLHFPFHARTSFHSISIFRCHITSHLILHMRLYVFPSIIHMYM